MLRTLTTWTSAQSSGAPYYTNLYFGGETSGEAGAAAAATIAFWQETDTRFVDEIAWTVQPEVEIVNPATGQVTSVVSVTGNNGSGQNAGEPLPWSSQGLIRWRTGVFVGGREIRGRTFIPGPSETDSVLGRPSTTYVSAMATAGANLITAGAGAGGFVVYSPTKGQDALVASATGWSEWAILRSRRD